MAQEDAGRWQAEVEASLFFAAGIEAFGAEAIADPGLRLDVLTARFVFEFFAHLPHEHTEVLGLMGRLRSPDSREQRPVSHHFSGVTCEMQQEIEFFRS